MFNSKAEVNKHVECCLKKINSEVERNLRCFAFAKLYMKVDDWDQALRYVNIYLTANASSSEAHRVRAKILENQGKKSQALEAYILSLDLDPKQNDLISKICELMSREDTNFDAGSARYFVERAQSVAPGDPSLMRLKERLVASAGKDPNDVTNLFLKELESRPLDVEMRCRLLRHLIQCNSVKDAYQHAFDIEQKQPAVFANHLAWYETVAMVVAAYRDSGSALTWQFWLLYLTVWERVVALSLSDRTRAIECAPLLLRFDEALQVASDKLPTCPHKQLVQECWRHFTGQLCWHLATFLYKQARKELVKYREAAAIGVPLLFATYAFRPADLHSLWLEHAPAACRTQVQRWHREAAFRCAQAGSVLKSMAHERSAIIVEKGTQGTTGMWREKTFKFLFVMREHQNRAKSAYFVLTEHLLDVPVKLPEADDLLSYTQTAQLLHPDSLHHQIWLGLNVPIGDVECCAFAGLPYTVKNLANCAVETLSVLDVQAFLYAAILCSRGLQDEQQHTAYSHPERPAVLPAACTDLLGTAAQRKWLQCVHRMYTNAPQADASDVRVTIMRGIETVRCSGNHGVDTVLLVHLARAFGERAERLTKKSEVEANEARAELYWRTAMHLLEKCKRNEAISYACSRLFDYKFKALGRDQLLQAINDGKLFLGKQAMRKQEYERACGYFKDICDPHASFHLAQIYKLLAERETHRKHVNVTSEMRSRSFTLMTKARDALYLTLDRLGMPGVDAKHPLNKVLGGEIEKIERLLSRIDPDNNRNECDGMSDENVSSAESESGNYSAHRADLSQAFATPQRAEARPSPERLDAQIRQLVANKELTLHRLLDAQKSMNDDLKQTIGAMAAQVGDVKRTVDELESLRNLVDVVFELRKEMAEVKKDVRELQKSKLSPADVLLGLEDDYPTDFNNSQSASNLSSLYSARVGNVHAPMMYPGSPYGYPPMYPYAGIAGIPGLHQSVASFPLQHPQSLGMDHLAMNLSQSMNPAFGQAGLMPPYQPPAGAYFPHSQNANLFMQTMMEPLASQDSPTVAPAHISTTSITSKAPPVNVVITSSDPLPPPTSTQPQLLPITIPQQHLRGNKPHNFQIPVTTSNPSTAPNVPAQTPLLGSATNLFSNVAAPLYSSLSTSSPKSSSSTALGLQIEKSLNHSFSHSADLETSRGEKAAGPDFKPIIPLADHGEQDEAVLFKEHAKLYRWRNSQWMERGTGELKILKSNSSQKIRIVMRRDQVLTVCANHYLTADMEITPKQSNGRSYEWTAHNFTDRTVSVEKMCAQFKTRELALKFYDEFERCKRELSQSAGDGTGTITSGASSSTTVSSAPSNPSLANLGGFTFISPPAFKPKDDEIATVASPVVATESTSPFASFTFTSTPPNPTTQSKPFLSFTLTPTSQATEAAKTSVPKTPTVTFASSLFGSSTPKTSAPTKTGEKSKDDSEHSEDFVPTAEFKPAVPLPDLVEVKTGEEGSEVLFEAKAKLFRHCSAAKEWKERGLGQMKVLKDANILRLVMRREQIHKVCCNHQILKTMNFSRNANVPNTVSWGAQDFSDGVLIPEMFTARFKTAEIASDFETTIKSQQNQMLDDNTLVDSGKPATSEPSQKVGFGDAFKPKPGDWECKNCLIRNAPKTFSCVACDTPKSGATSKTTPEDATKFCFGVSKTLTGSAGFTFGSTVAAPAPATGFGDAFKPKPGSWECKACYTRNDDDKGTCVSCETPKEAAPGDAAVSSSSSLKGVDLSTGGVTFSFGFPPTKPAITSSPATSATSFPSKDPSPASDLKLGSSLSFNFKPTTTGAEKGFPFTLAPKKEDADETKEETVFGSPHKVGFEFTPRSPRRQSGGPATEDEADNSYYEEEEANVYFKPVIPLPDKVMVTTGEEDESVLYCHRARLYRMVTGEWKERGIGDIKILFNQSQCKLRVLMRREQVHKICLNHNLSTNIQYIPKDERSWLFNAPDYSEGEIDHSSFCLRFKSAIPAKEFMAAVKSALRQLEGASGDDQDSTSDVEFVSETVVSFEDEQEARRLMLPPKFMAYKQLPDCNCAQCAKEDQMFATPSKSTYFTCETPSASQTSLFGTPTTSKSATTFSFTSFSNTSSTFTTPTQLPQGTGPASALKELLIKPSVLGAATTTSLFDKAPLSSSFSGGSLFGTRATTSNTSIFGGASITSTPDATKQFPFANNAKPCEALRSEKGSGEEVDTPIVLGADVTISFASVVANADNKSPFGMTRDKSENPFASLGSGAPVFGAKARTGASQQSGVAGEGDGDHDPHYEPIIPLPDEIVVKTGEEDEEVVFCERAKLYRFANKEWKERGLGNLKILHHPQNNTYRLLLRREVVHKIVLNQRITPDFNMQVLALVSNAWMWAGMNYGEEGHMLEQLAVRFKHEHTAQQFQTAIQTAIAAISVTAHETISEEEVDEDDDKYEFDEDDDERSVVFSCEAVLYQHDEKGEWVEVTDSGLAEIVYDSYSARITVMNSEGHIVSNTLIAANTEMQRMPDGGGQEFHWKGVECEDEDCMWKDLKLSIYTAEDAELFHAKFLEAHAYAEEAHIIQETGS